MREIPLWRTLLACTNPAAPQFKRLHQSQNPNPAAREEQCKPAPPAGGPKRHGLPRTLDMIGWFLIRLDYPHLISNHHEMIALDVRRSNPPSLFVIIPFIPFHSIPKKCTITNGDLSAVNIFRRGSADPLNFCAFVPGFETTSCELRARLLFQACTAVRRTKTQFHFR